MSDTIAKLGLPVLMPSQAQNTSPNNEALVLIDTLLQLAIETRNASVPPTEPENGAIFALGDAPQEAWGGSARDCLRNGPTGHGGSWHR